jgi:outer membrane receptor protein involved in Fe transport
VSAPGSPPSPIPAFGSGGAGLGSPGDVAKTVLSPAVSALPASTTTVDSRTIERLPVFSYGDIFRPLTGFDVSNYGQGGVGYGIALRGFSDSDHGKDIAYFIDGVPVNEVSSIHITNYADLNQILPEAVEKVEVIRGPFSVEHGDSNLGGTILVTTKRSEPVGSVSLSGGSFDTVRGVGTYSTTEGPVLPFLAFEGFGTSDYRQNSQVRRFNAFNKVTFPLEGGAVLSVRAQVYDNTFDAPGYASRDLLRAGLRSERTAENTTDGGRRQIQNVVANYLAGTPDDELSATLHAGHTFSSRFSDFGGGQRGQEEDRNTFGGRIRKVWTTSLAGIPTQVLVGANWRSDTIDITQGPTMARAYGSFNTRLGVTEHNLAGFGQVQAKPFEWLKLTGGARFDQFYLDVANTLDPSLSPKSEPHATSPKAGVAITPFSWLEVYANVGQGFRSPNAATELLDNRAVNPVKLESREVGAQARFERFSLLTAAYSTDINNEVFQPAPGLAAQNLGKSRRERAWTSKRGSA